jgi:hypothetical protein
MLHRIVREKISELKTQVILRWCRYGRRELRDRISVYINGYPAKKAMYSSLSRELKKLSSISY